MLKDMGRDSLPGEVLVQGARRKDVGGRQSFVFERVALLVAGVAEGQGRDDVAGARLVVEPLEDAALADRYAGMDAGDMTGRGRRKLRGDRRRSPLAEEALEKRVVVGKLLEEA